MLVHVRDFVSFILGGRPSRAPLAGEQIRPDERKLAEAERLLEDLRRQNDLIRQRRDEA
jgi:hypothetical protein